MVEKDSKELIDYLRVVWKWKWFIIIVTLACSIIVGIKSFSMPKIYEASMVIEPGVIDVGPDGKFIYLDLPSNIESKIESQAYNSKIFRKLDIDPKRFNLGFKTIQPGNSNTVKVRLEVGDVSKGIQALSTLFQELVEEYQHYVDSRKLELDERIAMNRRQLDISAGEKKYLEKEISLMKANTNRIIEERIVLLKKGGDNPDKLSLLIYTNIIQQNMTHHNNLNSQLARLMNSIERMKSEMETLRIKRDSVENIRLIQSPESSIYPIKAKKKLNVILAFFIGLMFSLLVTFFLEYLQKMGVYSKTSPAPDETLSIKNQGE